MVNNFCLVGKLLDNFKMSSTETCGYDVEFVGNPPNDVTCCICLHILKEPMQAEGCGHRFCQACVEKLRYLIFNRILLFSPHLLKSNTILAQFVICILYSHLLPFWKKQKNACS